MNPEIGLLFTSQWNVMVGYGGLFPYVPSQNGGMEMAHPSGASDSVFPKLEKELIEDTSSSWRLRRIPIPNRWAVAVNGPKPRNSDEDWNSW